jgi:CheY-like chemotaxis protein
VKRFLIIADDPAVRHLAVVFLEHLGFVVDEAPDMIGALIKARLRPPDAVLVFAHPRRLPASVFLGAYADVCATQGATPAPVALLMADIPPDAAIGAPVKTILRIPFSLDDLAATAWSLVEPEDGRFVSESSRRQPPSGRISDTVDGAGLPIPYETRPEGSCSPLSRTGHG